MQLIHDEAFFSERSIRERAERYGFSDLLPVQLFLWDCEVAAQLQRESDKAILKGGAAAQLHLPVNMQRGSVDIDLVGPFTEQDVQEMISRIEKRLPGVRFDRHVPRRPRVNIPLVTYYMKTPALVPTEMRKELEIKTEFLLEDLPTMPIETLSSIETFAVEIKEITCYTVTALIGDKLLTLAENTIGVADVADYPKQIYDVALLSERHVPTASGLSEIVETIELLTPIEAAYRDMELSPQDALRDVEHTMQRYSILDTPGADSNTKGNITSFQQFLVSGSQRKPWYEWCVRALHIRFLVQIITAIMEGESTAYEAARELSEAMSTARALQEVRGPEVKQIRTKLMNLADREIPYFRELRGKPLHRVFWQVISRRNLDAIRNLI